jgi:mono/diheme cytochrome c family protein
MSSNLPSPRENALFPTLFLIGVTVLLVYFAVPRPYREGALPTAVPTVVAAAPTTVAAAQPTPEDHLTLMAFGLEEVPSSGVQAGSRLFSTTCTACHGSDAKGILGLGKPLVDSPFVDKLNDDELVAFLHVGRPTTDPENTTKVAMPAKGGNPSLTDEDLNAIVDYIRSLNGAKVVVDTTVDATPIPTLKPFQTINLNSIGSSPATSPTESVPAVSASETPQIPVSEATATPVTSYGYDTQAQVTEEPTVAPVSEASVTPVISYGYDSQSQATEEAPVAPAEPTSAPESAPVTVDSIPTSVYSYQTGPDATNVPVTYEYEAQATAQP